MFSRSKRVRRDPYLTTYEAEQPIRLDEARLDAWALSLGQRRNGYQPPRRPHRGMLPDVDLSCAIATERGPGLIARLFRRVFRRRPEDPEQPAGGTEGSHAALGEARRKPYVWLVETESDIPDGGEAEPAAPAVEYNGSNRAA